MGFRVYLGPDDLDLIVEAAQLYEERGNYDGAQKLDRLARKVKATFLKHYAAESGQRLTNFTWRDVPTFLREE